MVTKPVVNGSSGTWGTILNQALDDLQSGIDTNTSNATTLTGRVTTAETNISNLQAGAGFYSGTASARAADTHYNTGAHYYETDTQRHFVGSTAKWVPIPGSMVFKARQATAQSFADGASVNLKCETLDFERLGGTYGTTTGIYTPGVAGWYEVTGAVSIAGGASGTRVCRWTVNGATQNGSGTQFPGNAVIQVLPARAFQVLLTATDTIALSFVQNSGGALSTNVTDYAQPTISAKYLGPA